MPVLLAVSALAQGEDLVRDPGHASQIACTFVKRAGTRQATGDAPARLERSGTWSAWVVEPTNDWQCYVRPRDGAILSIADYKADQAVYGRPPTKVRAIRTSQDAIARALALAVTMGVDVAKLTDRSADMICDGTNADLDPNNRKDRVNVELREPSPRGEGEGNVYSATFDVVTGDVLIAGGGQNLAYTSPQDLMSREEALAPLRAAFAAERDALLHRGQADQAASWDWPGDGFARDGMTLVTREAGAQNASGDYGARLRERGELRTAWGLHVPATGVAVLIDAENGNVIEAEIGASEAAPARDVQARMGTGRSSGGWHPRYEAPHPVASGLGIASLIGIAVAYRMYRKRR